MRQWSDVRRPIGLRRQGRDLRRRPHVLRPELQRQGVRLRQLRRLLRLMHVLDDADVLERRQRLRLHLFVVPEWPGVQRQRSVPVHSPMQRQSVRPRRLRRDLRQLHQLRRVDANMQRDWDRVPMLGKLVLRSRQRLVVQQQRRVCLHAELRRQELRLRRLHRKLRQLRQPGTMQRRRPVRALHRLSLPRGEWLSLRHRLLRRRSLLQRVRLRDGKHSLLVLQHGSGRRLVRAGLQRDHCLLQRQFLVRRVARGRCLLRAEPGRAMHGKLSVPRRLLQQRPRHAQRVRQL